MEQPPPALQPPVDGWVGTVELPGYRADRIVAKLDLLPEVDPDHLYFDLLLLDPQGRTQDNHSGPCLAMKRSLSLEERSCFVRVVAELVRHLAEEPRGLSGVARALAFIRENGVGMGRLVAAAQMLDEDCSERAVTRGLGHMLQLCLGADEAPTAMREVVAGLARSSGFGALDAPAPLKETPGRSQVSLTPRATKGPLVALGGLTRSGRFGGAQIPPPLGFDERVEAINDSGLVSQVGYVVRTVGKSRARHFLRETTDFHLVPQPEMFGF
ncbi:hypothetical protein [Piscinibacter sp.]|uniref:hypothetical protein n=1 Tax=Piscinibacter sp. TaxID=1903157 RepID=UPI002D12202B|nr:hypothetical protein [Albitalea sp.]HUG26562.1 hypothetical protein [Albitalea sp.]